MAPAGLPLKIRLIAQETVHRLDRGGLSNEAYRKKLDVAKIAGPLPPSPQVDVVFELENTGAQEIQLLVGGDVCGSLRLRLQGPGAVNITYRPDEQTDDLKPATIVKLPPGARHRWVFRDLDSSGARDSSRAYWTQAGEYHLSAGFTVAVRPAPKGSVPHWYHKDHGNIAITSGAVRMIVVEK